MYYAADDDDTTRAGGVVVERSPEIHNLASDRRKRINRQKYETRFVAAKAPGGTGVFS